MAQLLQIEKMIGYCIPAKSLISSPDCFGGEQDDVFSRQLPPKELAFSVVFTFGVSFLLHIVRRLDDGERKSS